MFKSMNFAGVYNLNMKSQNLPGLSDTKVNISMPFKFVRDGIMMRMKIDPMMLEDTLDLGDEVLVPSMEMTFLATDNSGAILNMESEGILDEKYFINQNTYKRLKALYGKFSENALDQVVLDANAKSSIVDVYTAALVKNLIFELEDVENNYATYSSEISSQLLGPLIGSVALFSNKRLNQIFNQKKDERIDMAIQSYRNLDKKLFESILQKFTSLFKINIEMQIMMTEGSHILPTSITTSHDYPTYEAFCTMINEVWLLYHQAYPEDSLGLHALYLGLDKNVVKKSYDYFVSIKLNIIYKLEDLIFLNTTSKELDFQKPEEANDISQEIKAYMPMIEQLLTNPSMLNEGAMTYDLF